MSASITFAGESQIALKQSQRKPLIIERFIFANVPGLDPKAPIDRAAGKPPASQIMYDYPIPKESAGFVNPNQVVYSAQLGSNIGDWDFNWVGLQDADGVLFAASHVPLQQKRKNIEPHQIGNNITRNFLVAFDGALELTGITIDASTWQHDFTVRQAGIDERERLSNRDIYGRACFFGSAAQLEKVASGYQLKPGVAYIEGHRVDLPAVLPVAPPGLPTTAWIDVALVGRLNTVMTGLWVEWGTAREDYVDSAGARHYCIPIADIVDSTTIKDRRPVEPVSGPLIQYLAARNGDYANLRARGTTKADVELENLPNAKSDDPATNSSEILATTKALNALSQQVSDSMVGMVAAFIMHTAPPGWLKWNGAEVSRTAYAKLFAVVGTRFGIGDGSTTFNLGDGRGAFIRGLDDGAGRDPGRVLGTLQASQNLSHSHTLITTAAPNHSHTAYADAQGNHVHNAWTDWAGEHTHTMDLGRGEEDSRNANNRGGVNRGYADATSAAGKHSHYVAMDQAGAHNHNVEISHSGGHSHDVTALYEGGLEARPLNQALLICVKY